VANQKKTLAAVFGAAAGVAAVTIAITWYVKSHSEEPIKDVQDAIKKAYEKIKEIEKIATTRLTPQG
jgi:hypothetical protein